MCSAWPDYCAKYHTHMSLLHTGGRKELLFSSIHSSMLMISSAIALLTGFHEVRVYGFAKSAEIAGGGAVMSPSHYCIELEWRILEVWSEAYQAKSKHGTQIIHQG